LLFNAMGTLADLAAEEAAVFFACK
jgi:hypothetical protein